MSDGLLMIFLIIIFAIGLNVMCEYERVIKFITERYLSFKISRNWHYWEPRWDTVGEPSIMDRIKELGNPDPPASDNEIQWLKGDDGVFWPPEYKGHKCRRCGKITAFKGDYTKKYVKSRGCPVLP